jgi:hypothetical protein
MINWLLDGKSRFPSLYLKYYSEDYRGVHSLARVAKDDIVLEVPLSHIMTSEVAKASVIGQSLLKSGVDLNSTHTYLACCQSCARGWLGEGAGEAEGRLTDLLFCPFVSLCRFAPRTPQSQLVLEAVPQHSAASQSCIRRTGGHFAFVCSVSLLLLLACPPSVIDSTTATCPFSSNKTSWRTSKVNTDAADETRRGRGAVDLHC